MRGSSSSFLVSGITGVLVRTNLAIFQSFVSQSSCLGQPAWMALVMDESIHVSSTSLSPVRLELPHLGHFLIGGESCLGSTGSLFSSGSMMRAQSLQYHTGMGLANIRCLDITQSQSSDLAQSLSRVLAYSGTHLSLAAFSTTSSVISLVFMNHCGREIISTGVLHRQHTPTLCVCGSVLVIFF